MKEGIKNPKIATEYTIKKQWERIMSVVRKNTANYNTIGRRPRQNRLILVSNCSICEKKKPKIIKDQEASRLELH